MHHLILGVSIALTLAAAAGGQETPAVSWPAQSRECRPWAYWWWMGSAVSEGEITRHLEMYRQAGLGGVHIIPIYAAKGAEDRTIPFLSERWMKMLAHTVREGKRLDLGVDMSCGTGWPFGGPMVSNADTAMKIAFAVYTPDSNQKVHAKLPTGAVQAIVAYGEDGKTVDLTEKAKAGKAATLDWTAPPGRWTVHAAVQSPTGMKVKRAAPGGEGNVLNYYASGPLLRYLGEFDKAFAAVPGVMVRSVYNDSYEISAANWTGDLFEQFQKRRGYDLRKYLPALQGLDKAEVNGRVRSDYRQTISDLLLDEFTRPWVEWAHRHGAIARNEAHGSPGNLLDLYAAADIPETEMFRNTCLAMAGEHSGSDDGEFGKTEILVNKLSSSAAHVAGKRLTSSESCTWLGEHFQVPLRHAKTEIDVLFLAGINHVFFHGIAFSPADAPWPGWLFYAETQFAPTMPWWRDMPALNGYIARCQSFLQEGKPDNDVLLYQPIFDFWSSEARGRDPLLTMLTVHNTEHWMEKGMPGFTEAGHLLWKRGYGFDCISDKLISEALSVREGRIVSRGGTYGALVIPRCTHMPAETLEKIAELARQGATVVVVDALPGDVPGLKDVESRRARLKSAADSLGQSKVRVGADLNAMLEQAGVQRFALADESIQFIRRTTDNGRIYFVANFGEKALDRWVELPDGGRAVAVFDPMSNSAAVARCQSAGGRLKLHLQLQPGETRIVRTFDAAVDGPRWVDYAAGQPVALGGPWQVDFIEGGPTLPKGQSISALGSWTDFASDREALRAFAGTARYTLRFDRPAGDAEAWRIDLGQVCHSAKVTLNGKLVGTIIARPFRTVPLPGLKAKENVLEIEVTNLAANRIADMDRRKVAWQNFFFVSIAYKPFNAADWTPQPSGLIGPVQLVPLGKRGE